MAYQLAPGERIRRQTQGLQSINGQYKLALQPNGNLDVRDSSNSVIWQTNTASNDPGRRAEWAIMQGNGNFELRSIQNEVVWQTHSSGHHGAWLRLMNDGNLEISVGDDCAWWSLHPCRVEETVEVPYVREELISYARFLIEQAGLRAEFGGDCSGNNTPTGEAWVESQNPAGGAKVRRGTTVRCGCASRPFD